MTRNELIIMIEDIILTNHGDGYWYDMAADEIVMALEGEAFIGIKDDKVLDFFSKT